ncbi:MAG: autoinducer binding domain-containing protein [Burkholderiales bacterium]|nr:autoinducer binding domain-containing protein [Burkholderiales bacterium]
MHTFSQFFPDLFDTKSKDDLFSALLKFAHQHEFNLAMIGYSPNKSVPNAAVWVDNYPKNWNPGDPSLCIRDPIIAEISRQPLPVVWGPQTYESTGTMDLWDQSAQYGFHSGIVTPLWLGDSKRMLIALTRDKPLDDNPARLMELVGDQLLFTSCAQMIANGLFEEARPARAEEPPKLTSRETECLKYTLDGKTAWEVGVILGMSERTANFHLQNAIRKLNVCNKHQAAIVANKLGLLNV